MTAGRPTDYTPEMADKICSLVASSSEGLKKICAQNSDIPVDSTIYLWLANHKEFSRKYRDAKEAQGLCYSEKVMDLLWEVDERNEAIAKAKLILDGAKWHLSKLAPKQFGDKKEKENPQENTAKIVAEALAPLIKKHERDY